MTPTKKSQRELADQYKNRLEQMKVYQKQYRKRMQDAYHAVYGKKSKRSTRKP